MARIWAFFTTNNRMNATHNSRPGRARLQPSQPVRLNAARREPRPARTFAIICDALHKKPLEKAFTLIELIGVLAVLAILAAIIVPNLLHQLDVAVSQQEVATLQGYGSALQSSICRNFYIPGQNDWASSIAAEYGTGTYEVATNSRGQPRVFLIDSNFTIGANGQGLPYTQSNYPYGSQVTSSNMVIPPVSPRLMILSTIGKPLPTTYTAADFTNIWNTADGTPPTNATGFSSWTANDAYDLKVQRINLSPLFVKLALSTYASTTNGQYAIINGSTNLVINSAPLATNGVPAYSYYLQNTALRLINTSSGTTNSDQILSHDTSFVYYQNVWLSSISTTNIFPPIIGGGAAVSFDLNAIVSSFQVARPNPYALSNVTQTNVAQDMINYMNAYYAWATNNFPNTTLYSNAVSAQSIMSTDLSNLINGL